MINVSDAFKQKLQDGKKVWQEVEITFPDGTVKTVKDEIMGGNCTFSDCAESSSFPIGCVVCKSMALELDNSQDQWKNYYFYQAKVHSYLKMQIDASTVETIDKGVYTITTPEQYGELLSFTALDDMYKVNATYTSKLVLPQTIISLVRDACDTLNIPFGGTMQHGNLIISEVPENMTFRQLFGWAAMLETANARLDNKGYLHFIKWDFSNGQEDCNAVVDADGNVIFKGGASIDSESFISPTGNWTIDSDGFLTLIESVTDVSEKLKDFFTSPTVSSDDIIITGIKLKNRENEAMYGNTGYVLELENELVADSSLDTVAAQIGDSIIGAKFRSMSGELAYNPLIEFGDMAYTYDRKWNRYITPLTDVSCSVNGKTAVKTQADDPIRGMSKFVSDGTKAIVEARRLVKKERSTREKAVKRLEETLKTSSGLYETSVPQEDGSIITYLHDKPTLTESKNVIKFTAEAIGVSNDGGKTYPYGFAMTGELITRLLYAEGINADYINAGTLVVRDKSGNAIFEADMDTGSVTLDGSCVTIGGKPLDEKIEDVENMAALARNMTMQLDNDYQGIPVDSNGNYTEFPECTTTATVMYGTQDITDNCTYTITTSQNIQGNWNKETKTYTVTGLTADSGWVNIKAAYLNNLAVSKQFSLAKQYAGPQGIPGTVGTDGKTTYLHIQYAPVQNPTAAQMSKTPNKYIGTYTDFSGVDSTDPSKYTWAKFEGDQGAQGPKGADGKSSYTWMKYATRPDGLDMSDNPDYVPLLDSAGSPILDSAGEQIYTVTQATYIGIATNKDTATESTNPADYTWSRFRGVDGYDGKDGANGIPGKDGEDGKTQYTHLAYANSADGKTDFSVSDGNREYIGMYVDFVEADSTDPTKYTWSLIKGANGAQGVPGTPGVNGKTPYFHIAYANSADGRTGFSVDDSVNKLYIGQYTDYTPDDSTNPTKYSWTKIKGEQGTAGRTYFFQSNADVLLMGADKKITPASLIVDSFYRDGNGEIAQSQKGWWKLEKSTDNGATWSALTVSQTAALDRLNINVNSLSLKAHDMLKVSLYFDQSKTKLADYQTFSVAIDVAALTQEDIVDILSNDGSLKGLYYLDGHLYISFDAAKGGTLILGGKNNGDGTQILYDANGKRVSKSDNDGTLYYKTYTDENNYTGFLFNKNGISFVEWVKGVETITPGIINFTADRTYINNNVYVYGWEGKARRKPVTSAGDAGSRIDYIGTGTGTNGGKEYRRMAVRGQWGSTTENYYATDYVYTNTGVSDIRLQENVKDSKVEALETVRRMKVRQFDWKKGGHQSIGFVADELEEIDPNLALGGGYDENGEMDIKQINSQYLLNYAIKAIQELSAKVDEQEKHIKELERRLQNGKI